MGVQSAQQICEAFKIAVKQKNASVASAKLNELKELILEFETLSTTDSQSTLASQEKTIARDFYEYAVIFSIDMEDKELFQRYLSSLRPIYTIKGLPESEAMSTVLGLNLLHLLVDNKLSEFHCELELLSESIRKHPNIDFCTQLDQHLMVGSYDQVLSAAENPPVAYYSFFLRSLLKTVRVNVGDCAAAAYRTLEIPAATRMLMFHSDLETLQFLTETYPAWTVEGTMIHLQGTKATSQSEIPSVKLIQQQLTYANELERIV